MTFTYDFKNDDDTVFFAYNYPYTYSDLTDELTAIERDQTKQEFISRNVLCRTIAGNKCEYLTITAKNDPDVNISYVKILIAKIGKKGSLLEC